MAAPISALSVLLTALVALVPLAAAGCHQEERHRVDVESKKTPDEITVEPRTELLLTYPCSQKCHAKREPNPTRRTLVAFHSVRNKEFHHGDAAGWCYQCHSQQNIDRLVISNGSLVTFDEAYLLCGSCHGDKLRDWRLAVHGKTMGKWTGEKIKRSCTACHNPHNPRFGRLTPEQAPPPPQLVGKTNVTGAAH